MMDELAGLLGVQEQFHGCHASKEDWFKDMVVSAQESYPDFPSFEEFRERDLPGCWRNTTTPMASFFEDPVTNPLSTPSGKIEIYSETWANPQ